MKNVKIALLGMGNVGKGVWKILNMNKEELQRRSGYNIEVSKILVKDITKKRGLDVPKEVLTTNYEEILEDNDIEIVIEVIGGCDLAVKYMIEAMRKKKHIVTANKMAIAMKGDTLFKVASEEQVMIYYEASVGGGIPIIHEIKESLTANKIKEVTGIINGTTNYILTKMTFEGFSFDEALKEAQEKGYAESDPTSDVDGFDAMYKLSILSSLAFDNIVSTDYIYREGIRNISSIDIDYAKEFGYVIKFLAIVKENNGELDLRVHPTMIPSTHPLANVNDSFNAIFIKGNAVGDLMFYGRGAGELPTGSAVVADVISILRNKQNKIESLNYKIVNNNIKNIKDVQSEYYIRITVEDIPGILGEISTIFGENKVSILSVIQRGKRQEKVTLVFVAHKTFEENIKKSIKMIKHLKNVKKIENIIRIENFSN